MRAWEKNFRQVKPYTPGEQPKSTRVIKLNTNENPYPPSPAAAEVLRSMAPALFRKYPDPDAVLLRDAIAEYYGISRDRVFAGVGSDDVLAMLFLTIHAKGTLITGYTVVKNFLADFFPAVGADSYLFIIGRNSIAGSRRFRSHITLWFGKTVLISFRICFRIVSRTDCH